MERLWKDGKQGDINPALIDIVVGFVPDMRSSCKSTEVLSEG